MSTRILFLCLARNCADTLPRFFAYLKQLESRGFSCTAMIGENGSTDGTRKLLDHSANEKLIVLDTSPMSREGSRLIRMAVGRQMMFDAALARGIDEAYICVVDLDNVASTLPDSASMQTAIECLRAESSLFAIGATSLPVYYDLLSLRADGLECLSRLNTELTKAKSHPLSYYRFHREHIYRIQKQVTSMIPMQCTSSFNGFCLYNSVDYYLGSYRASDEADVCEHVSLHLSIGRVTGKKMLISPKLVIKAPADHIPVGFFKFWFDRIAKKLYGRK